MFPRSYFGAHYFAPRYFPQSQGSGPVGPTDHYLLILGVGHLWLLFCLL